MRNSLILNIQRFSIHDGPGIRTTVFFKGCPLRCVWCSNPESQNYNRQLTWDKKKCKLCNKCTKYQSYCIDDHIYLDKVDKKHYDDIASICPYSAITVEGHKYSVDYLVEECLKDYDYYETSGGGVTLSGGEVLSHPDFAKDLLIKLKEHNIHTAIETTGFCNRDDLIKIIDQADFIQYDLKHYDDCVHSTNTGVSNAIIIDNLKYIIDNNYDVLVRIPIIPGFNSELDDIKKFIVLCKELKIKNIELLPFHQMGKNKYELLNMKYKMEQYPSYYKEDLVEHVKLFNENNISCFVK